jgi:hypothetical protein
MDYAALRTELTTDPVTLGYAGLTDTLAAAKLNATDTSRTATRTAVPVQEVFNAIDDGAWPTAGSLSESKLRTVLGMPQVDASNTNTRGILGAVFPASGATAATRTRLLALSTQTVSRAVELGLGPVLTSDVTKARAGVW